MNMLCAVVSCYCMSQRRDSTNRQNALKISGAAKAQPATGTGKIRPASVAFVHNFLDEYGLDPYEFRLYAHIIRRTGGKTEGVCFASLNKIAKICKMSPRKAQQAMKVLIKANLVTQNKRIGRTDEYRVMPASDWVSSEDLEGIRAALSTANVQKSDQDVIAS
jgi:predicted metal-binding transcription factor (methanogenesis marker protein 9)